MNDNRLREEMCRLGRSLFERGYTHGASGNISVRTDDGILVTPTNASLGDLDPAALSLVDASGRVLSGRSPTKELALHNSFYASRDGTGAVVHLHSTHSVAVSTLDGLDHNDVFPPLTAYQLMRVGKVALLPYFEPGDPRIGKAIEELRGTYGSILLANHGPVVASYTLDDAVNAMEELEQTARVYLLVGSRPLRLVPNSTE
jgi:ribulose-5-phosphate 4-epimerase/fuculose-1-phosphate aldolase